ncbi:hypothetical protein [Pandoraea terrae]|uniref:hypothetical protein n=1 Tax=Pandoraea terrae TaxID=1537710 RepID=UPI00177ECB7A|nr:hypothetical protein [Pandoraea terrae]
METTSQITTRPPGLSTRRISRNVGASFGAARSPGLGERLPFRVSGHNDVKLVMLLAQPDED